MSEPNRQDDLDAVLWRQCASSAAMPGRGQCPGEMDLASWLDGRAEPALAERIEAHLAACPDCLQAAEELRAILGAAPQTIPLQVIQRAKALARRSARRPAKLWLRVARWGAAAAAAVVVSYAGFAAGAGVRHSRQAVHAAVVGEATFGLEDGQAEGRLADDEAAGDVLAALMEVKP